MEKNIATSFNDEYSKLGDEILKGRAEFIKKNRGKIAERLCKIISYKFQEDNIDQTPLEPEQMIFSLKPSLRKNH